MVWIRDDLDKTSRKAVEGCFAEEAVGVALGRFHCLRAETSSVPDPRVERDLLERAPILFFFDPAGRLVDTLEGRKATSRAAVCNRLEKLWAISYVVPLREHVRRMDDILDRRQDLERRRAALAGKLAGAAGNPRKLAVLGRKKAELERAAKRIEDDEGKFVAACRLREAFRPGEPEE